MQFFIVDLKKIKKKEKKKKKDWCFCLYCVGGDIGEREREEEEGDVGNWKENEVKR